MQYTEQAFQFVVNSSLRDITPTTAGYSLPAFPGHESRMMNKNCYLLHYVYTGKGEIHIRDTVYYAHAGQAFLIQPEDKGFHKADDQEPWGLRWVIFTGELAQDFSSLPPVFDLPPDCLRHLKSLQYYSEELGHLLASDLLELYAKLIKSRSSKRNYIQKTTSFIQLHYMEPLTIQSIADHVGINRHYLARFFKEKTGISVQEQLVSVRLFESKRCLRLGYSVQETAFLCGFNDASTYSRLFKKKEGCSPQMWKNTELKDISALAVQMQQQDKKA